MNKNRPKPATEDNKTEGEKRIIVGVGASAGGLEALQAFFERMPLDTGLTFVVIQHLSPDFKSLMDELLARYTSLNIQIAVEGITVMPNTIYLIPPRKNLSVFHNQLFLDDQHSKKGLNLPVDIFFRSLAADKGKDAIGVILSGTGSDGTLGARAIKEAGGMIMAQDEQSAKFDGMPRNVIATGLADYILPPNMMAEELVKYTTHPFVQKSQLLEGMGSKDLDTLTKILLILRDHNGTDFSYYKENTIVRRLERRVSINQFNNLEDYLVYLSESNKEKETLYKEMLIGVTRFFREQEAFESLQKKVLPSICANGRKMIRVWSAGCSTGEEVYSLAMVIKDAIDKERLDVECKIFATDIDKQALDVAGQGLYPESISADIPPYYLAKYLSPRDNGYLVSDDIRRMIVFASHNLLKDPPFSKLDLIVCRNLFIYFKADIQSRLLATFYASLQPNAFMFMGSSETIGDMGDAFETIDSKWKIYKRKPGYKPPLFQHTGLPHSYKAVSSHLLATQKSRQPERMRFDDILNGIFEAFVPPSVIIDHDDNIIQIINNTHEFIKAQPGHFSPNLFANLPHELGLFVSTLLRKLKKEGKAIKLEHITGLKGAKNRVIAILGQPLFAGATHYYMLSFLSEDKKQGSTKAVSSAHDIDKQAVERMSEMEKELQFARESLQATVEELETANEELQSSNEELIASNEELQSTNEELQSVNEELYTVNSEYQNKIEELTRLNNDLNNLLNNTEVGALYLDGKLCIRKITPIISKITNIRENDKGRPVSHISLMDNYPDLLQDITKVSETLQAINKEVMAPDGTDYYCRIRPYRSDVNAVDGILITFVDISKLTFTQERLRQKQTLLNTVLDNSPLAKVMVNANGQITYANKPAEDIFGISQKQILERTYDASVWEITDLDGRPIKPDDLPFSMIKKTLEPVLGFQHYIAIPGKKRCLLTINGTPLIDKHKKFQGGVFAIAKANKI